MQESSLSEVLHSVIQQAPPLPLQSPDRWELSIIKWDWVKVSKLSISSLPLNIPVQEAEGIHSSQCPAAQLCMMLICKHHCSHWRRQSITSHRQTLWWDRDQLISGLCSEHHWQRKWLRISHFQVLAVGPHQGHLHLSILWMKERGESVQECKRCMLRLTSAMTAGQGMMLVK